MGIRRTISFAAVFGYAFAVALGCGGAESNSGFAGAYSGEYLSGTTLGVVQMNISSGGSVTGKFITGTNVQNITGDIGYAGNLTLAINGITGFISGTLSSPAHATTVSATLSNTSAANPIYVAMVVNPVVVSTTTNAFAGDYAGTDANTSLGITTPCALTVDAAGNVSGTLITQGSSGTYEMVNVTGTVATSTSTSGTGIVTTSNTLSVNGFLNGASLGMGTGSVSESNGIFTGNFVDWNSEGNTLSLSILPSPSSLRARP